MKKRVKMICFDMDGTIADLYGVDNWLTDLENHNARPYEVAKPLHDMTALNALLEQATAKGIEIRVITWLANGADRQYKKETRVAKRAWLKAQGFATTNNTCKPLALNHQHLDFILCQGGIFRHNCLCECNGFGFQFSFYSR